MINQPTDRQAFAPPPNKGRRPALYNLMLYDKVAYNEFIQLIRLGSYDYVAAEKIGVHQTSFARWMRLGLDEYEGWHLLSEEIENEEELSSSEKDQRWAEEFEPTCYYKFFCDVMQAKAESRSLREAQVAHDHPMQWLRYGPGRTRAGREGWTDFKEGIEVTVHGDDMAPPVRIAADGREDAGPQDLVDTIKVLADSLFLPSLPEMAKALIEQDPTLIERSKETTDGESEKGNGR